jgi:hypothetical protein
MNEVQVRYDKVRGCGYRKEGGLYLISGGESVHCGAFPIELKRCPCCDQGIKPSRGWTWLNLDLLRSGMECPEEPSYCKTCAMSNPVGKVGLLWIGEQFYPTPADFNDEAAAQGISRRISSVPNGFEVGKTWVALAHRKAVSRVCECEGKPECEKCGGDGVEHIPAIFRMFRPEAIEYVVKGDETDQELEAMDKRGITPVRVMRADETPVML